VKRPAPYIDERSTERESVLRNAVGAVWIAAIGGAISLQDADRVNAELMRAHKRMVRSLADAETNEGREQSRSSSVVPGGARR
jgi:hypothetical protein